MKRTLSTKPIHRKLGASRGTQRAGMHRDAFLQSGFTLMELLVSVSILGLLSLAILFGFRVGMNSWAKGERGLERTRTTQATFDLLTRQIASMVPYYSVQKIKESPVDVLLFQGTETALRFVSTFSVRSRSAGGLRLVEYFLVDSKGEGGRMLVANDSPLPDDRSLSATVFSEISRTEDNRVFARFQDFMQFPASLSLAEGIETVQFRFFSRPAPRTGTVIQRRTRSGQPLDLLPLGVAIKVRWHDERRVPVKELSMVVPILSADL